MKQIFKKKEKALKSQIKKNASSHKIGKVYDQYHLFILNLAASENKSANFLYASPRYKNFAENLIYELIPPGKKVLEIGCGDGRLSFRLAKKNCQMTGLDISSIALALAKKNFSSDNLSFVQADGRQLKSVGEKSGLFDFAVSKDFIEHLPPNDHIKHFQEIYEILKKEGSYVFFVPPKLTPDSRKGLHFKEYGMEDIRKIVLLNNNWAKQEIYFLQLKILGINPLISDSFASFLEKYENIIKRLKIYKILPFFLNKLIIPRYVVKLDKKQ